MRKYQFIISFLSIMIILTACASNNNNQSNEQAISKSGEDEEVEEKLIKIGVVTPEDTALTDAAIKFKDVVESETDGSIKVEVYPNGQLGEESDMIDNMQLGSQEAAIISSLIVANSVPVFDVLNYPYMMPDMNKTSEILNGEIGNDLAGELEPVGMKGLSFMSQGYYMVTNNVKPIENLEDFKNLTIRTVEMPTIMDIYSALGANPTPMAFSDVYTGLQQGVIDGQVNPPSQIYTMKFHEHQKYISNTTELSGISVLIMSLDFYDSLSSEEKQVIDMAAKQAADYNDEITEEMEAEYIEILKEEGLEYNDASDSAIQEMKEATRSVIEKHAGELELEYVERIQNALN